MITFQIPSFELISVLVLTLLVFCPNVQNAEVSPAKFEVWGPGLEVDVVLPVRYFYIHAVDANGHKINESVGESSLTVLIRAKNDAGRTRVWTKVLDRQDGSYLVRYRLYGSYKDLEIQIRYNKEDVAKSPYLLPGISYNEKCNCPEPSPAKWLKSYNCPSSYPQIQRDLAKFSKVDMVDVWQEVEKRFNQPGSKSLCHYVVKNNKIYRRTQGQHVGFKMFMDAVLLSLTRKVKLPDLEFVVNLGDWPLMFEHSRGKPIPIFSWCGSDDTLDIIMPTYDITESTLESMARISLDMQSVQGNSGPAWHNKTSLAFFRGRDSRQERLDLVKLSHAHPDVIDARLTNMFFFKHTPDLGELQKPISFFDFFKHKYQINIDGTVAAYRLPYLLAGGSLVLKQDSPYYEFFYKDLKPYVHYVPFKRDLSDLLTQIQWAKDHDEEAQQIARNAQEFVREKLQATEIFCYHMVLFREYVKRLSSTVEVREGMEEVIETKVDHMDQACQCERNTQNQGNQKDEL